MMLLRPWRVDEYFYLSLYWKHKNTAQVLNILHIYPIAVFAEDYIIIIILTNIKGWI